MLLNIPYMSFDEYTFRHKTIMLNFGTLHWRNLRIDMARLSL